MEIGRLKTINLTKAKSIKIYMWRRKLGFHLDGQPTSDFLTEVSNNLLICMKSVVLKSNENNMWYMLHHFLSSILLCCQSKNVGKMVELIQNVQLTRVAGRTGALDLGKRS